MKESWQQSGMMRKVVGVKIQKMQSSKYVHKSMNIHLHVEVQDNLHFPLYFLCENIICTLNSTPARPL
jgi:hypothetical protein